MIGTQDTENTHEQRTVSGSFSEEDVSKFAELSGDHNPLHTDWGYAEETRFGRPIVHGALVASMISAALGKFDGTVIFVDQELNFLHPVDTGQELVAVATEREVDGKMHEMDTKVVDNHNDPVISGTATVMIE